MNKVVKHIILLTGQAEDIESSHSYRGHLSTESSKGFKQRSENITSGNKLLNKNIKNHLKKFIKDLKRNYLIVYIESPEPCYFHKCKLS